MSFSAKVKQELTKTENMPPCCMHALTYGLLLFARSFNYSGISIMTEHECVAEKYRDCVNSECGVCPELKISKAGKYTVSVTGTDSKKKVFECFSLSGNEAVMRINRGNLLNESTGDPSEAWNCCNGAFLRGAFLSCGTISDPNKGYHLEFVVPFRALSRDLEKMLTEYNLKAKTMTRRGINVIYLKDSESIEDLLNIMGAQNAAFEIMDIKIFKDVRNSANRKSNFSVANISRTVKASFDQVEAFNKLIENGVYDTLDEPSKFFLNLRIENPDASLRELGQMYNPPISRSAVNYKIKKLMELYEKSDKKTENTKPEE